MKILSLMAFCYFSQIKIITRSKQCCIFSLEKNGNCFTFCTYTQDGITPRLDWYMKKGVYTRVTQNNCHLFQVLQNIRRISHSNAKHCAPIRGKFRNNSIQQNWKSNPNVTTCSISRLQNHSMNSEI